VPPRAAGVARSAATPDLLPAVPPERDLMPWLLRRLKASAEEADAVGHAAGVALAALARD
jgi:hypothetical protein